MTDPAGPTINDESFEPAPLPVVPPSLGRHLGEALEAAPAEHEADPGGIALTDDEEILFQRALVALRDAEDEAGPYGAADNRLAAQLQSYLAAHPEIDGVHVQASFVGAEAKYDSRDIRHLRSLIPALRNLLGIPHRDERPPLRDAPHELPDGAKVAIFGDWGSGLYGAQAIARRITEAGDYEAAVHLGDTYYSGTRAEIDQNLVRFLPTVRPGGVRRVCSSNHEMYSGGKPFYELALPACDQPSTVFTLRHRTWVFVGLDTGYEDGRIDDAQQRWLEETVAGLGPEQKLVLLTHHHPWSTSKDQNRALLEDLAPALERGVAAWYWGHVHACELFEPSALATQGRAFHGRCIGHSGYPYFRQSFPADAPTIATPQPGIELRQVAATEHRPGALVLDGPNEYLGSDAPRYGPNGFLSVVVDGSELHETLLGPDGTALWHGTIS